MMIKVDRSNRRTEEEETTSPDAGPGANIPPSGPNILLSTALFSAIFSLLFTCMWAVTLLHFQGVPHGPNAPHQKEHNLYPRFGSESGPFSHEEATVRKLEQTRRALQEEIIYACIKTGKGGKGGEVRIVSSLSGCTKAESGLQWNAQGPPGK